MVSPVSGYASDPLQPAASSLSATVADGVQHGTGSGKASGVLGGGSGAAPQDVTDISENALLKALKEQSVGRFSRQAARLPQSYNAEKVAYFRSLVDQGQTAVYLSQVDWGTVAGAMQQGPALAR